MGSQRNRKSSSVAMKATELAMVVPQVVAHRMTRMALAGASPSARDRREFQLMVSEKHDAFMQAWLGMANEAMRVNHAIGTSVFLAFMNPFANRGVSASSISQSVQNAAVNVVCKGLDPVHRKAVANAKRLRYTKLR